MALLRVSPSLRDIDVPFPLVDYIVLSPKAHHWQSGNIDYDPRVSYRVLEPNGDTVDQHYVLVPAGTEVERVIARRMLLQLVKILEPKGCPVLVNLGVGIPALVSTLSAKEELSILLARLVLVIARSGWSPGNSKL